MDRTQSFRTSEQLFVCYGGQQKGKAVSKQRMAHGIVDAITLAYVAQGVPCPLRLRAHSPRGVALSWALARGLWVVALRGPVQSRLAVSLTPNSPESSLTRQTLSSPPALRHPDVAERLAPGLSANEFLKSGV